jgi:hypothetical protein
MRARTYLAAASATAAIAAASAAMPAFAADTAGHTLRFDAVQVARHAFGKTTAAVLDKDVQAGKIIATDGLDWSGRTATVALALSHGYLYGRFTINATTGAFAGKVTGGTGAYRGDTGTISGHAISAGRRPPSPSPITPKRTRAPRGRPTCMPARCRLTRCRGAPQGSCPRPRRLVQGGAEQRRPGRGGSRPLSAAVSHSISATRRVDY